MVHATLDVGPVIEQLERDLGIGDETVARTLGVDRRTVERWHASRTVPQGKGRSRLGELLNLRDLLIQLFKDAETTRLWLHDRSPYLGGFTRVDALNIGYLERVRADAMGLAGGIYA